MKRRKEISIEEKMKYFEMSLKEKIAFCSGHDTWRTKKYEEYGISELMMSDGPHGIRLQTGDGDILGVNQSVPATCFPTASIVACSFDKLLLEKMGKALAKEAKANGIGMLLGPGVNIKRNPLCGRNFEYFSEDPYLAGTLAAAYICSVEKMGIGTSLKHFACNNQEYFRMLSDSQLSERALRELYLRPFEIAVKKGKPASVMCAYNKVNGEYCTENKHLLTDILRNEWGYEGLTITDWFAVSDRSRAFEAGCDLVMPGGSCYGEEESLQKVQKGKLDIKCIKESAERVRKTVDKYAQKKDSKAWVDYEKHHELAFEIASESAVLIKNEGDLLPLDNLENTAVIGLMAENFRFQGCGSSCINPVKVEQVRDILADVPYARGYEQDGSTQEVLLEEARKLAAEKKAVLIFAGLPDSYEAEGFDREDMKMPMGHNLLIEAVAKVNPNVIVVLCCGGVVELPWINDVKSILYMGLAGQAGAKAAVSLLLGMRNPCGKLAETWPKYYSDCPSHTYYSHGNIDAEYREGIYVGYRYYDKVEKEVSFLFGHGLSYTTFSYSNLEISEDRIRAVVKNTGKKAGAEVAMLFVGMENSGLHRPVRELKGYQKIFLSPGESGIVEFPLDDDTFSVWYEGWKCETGRYTIEVGGSLDKLALKGGIEKQGETIKKMEIDQDSWYQSLKGKPDRKEWCMSLSSPVFKRKKKPYDVNSTLCEVAEDSRLAKLLYRYLERSQAKKFGRDSLRYRTLMKFADESTLRAVQMSLKKKGHFAQAFADFGNKKILRGLYHLLW